jgi:two-component sensor histidine kinase
LVTCHTILADRSCARGSQRSLRKGWERAIEAERAKDLLYRELRHRTKNDFAMAVSVLNLQARTQIKLEIRQALADAASRLFEQGA